MFSGALIFKTGFKSIPNRTINNHILTNVDADVALIINRVLTAHN